MTAPTYDGGESLLSIKGSAQTEAGVSGRVQNEHDPELGHVKREGKGKKRVDKKGKVNKIAGLYTRHLGKEQPQAEKVQGKEESMTAILFKRYRLRDAGRP